MIFKKHKGQIYDVELSPKEQKALDALINQQILEQHRQFSDDFDYMILSVLTGMSTEISVNEPTCCL